MSMTYDSSFLYDRSGYTFEGGVTGVPGLPNVGVFIAFSDSPYVANPGWTEVTQYVRTIPNIRRSRSDDWSTFSGSATVVLSNRDQRFNPFNTSSPYNGLLKPRRQIKIVANAGQYTNLVANPSFETNTTGWTSNLTLSRITTDDYVGVASAQVVANTASNIAALYLSTGNYATVTPGSTYTASVYVKNTVGADRGHHIQIAWRTSAGVIISNTTSATTTVAAVDGWVRLSVTGIAPVNAGLAGLNCFMQTTNGAIGNTSLFDAVMLTETPTVVPYFDGSSPNAYWTGTANASTSVLPQQYPIFRGYIAGWPVEFANNGEDSTVTIECFDALALLANETTPQDLAQYYALSLDPVTYFPFNDPIDPVSSGKVLKGYGRKPFNLAPPFPETRFINSSSMAEGLAPSSIEIPSATSYDTFFGVTDASDNVSFSYCGWWSCPNNPDPILTFRMIANCTINRVLAAFQYFPSTGKLRVVTQYRLSAFSNTERFYEASVVIDPTAAHFSAVSVNADGTLDSVFLDGGAVAMSLTSTSTPGYASNIENSFYISLIRRQDWFIYERKLTTTEIQNIYRLGNARFEESTSARFNRLIALTPFPASLTSVPASPVGVVSELKAGGTSLVNELNVTRNSEGGELYVSKSGVITMTERNSQLQGRSATTQAVFKDDGTNLKYAGDFNLRFDADSVVNDLRLSVTGGLDVNAVDSNSQSAYGKQSQSVDTYLSTIADAQSLANSRLAIFDTPIPQVSPLEVGITRSLSQWQTLLSLELLDQIEVTRTPSVGSVFSDRLLVNEISHSITPEDWSMSIVGSARYSEWFTIDIDFIDGDRLIA